MSTWYRSKPPGSRMGLVDELEHLRYRGGIGPGVYDVHSPRLPEVPEVEALLRRALERRRC